MNWVKDIKDNKIIFDNDYSIVVNEPEEIFLTISPSVSQRIPRGSGKTMLFGYDMNPVYYPFCRKIYRVKSDKHLISEYNHPHVAGVHQRKISSSYNNIDKKDIWFFDYTKSNKYEYELLSSIEHLKRFNDVFSSLVDLSTDLMTIGNLPIMYEWIRFYKNGSLREYGLTDNQYKHIAEILEGFYKENVVACTKYIFLRQSYTLGM